MRRREFYSRKNELKLAVLRTEIEAGIAALSRGEYTEVDDADLETFLDSLTVDEPYSITGRRFSPSDRGNP